MKKENTPQYTDLEVVKNDYPEREYEITVTISEFNSVCPKTGLPDFGTIYVTYTPYKHIVELKSLKLYVVKFRNLGIFHEHVTNKILEDFQKACQPKKIYVRGDFHPRGGIKTTVTANN